MLVRTKTLFRRLDEAESRFEKERRRLIEENERLLDRLMVLTDKPMPDSSPWPDAPQDALGMIDPDAMLGDEAYA